MWQRIQTLYLILATALAGVLFFINKAVLIGAGGEITEEFRYTAYIPYLILLIIITILNVISLNSFKFRIFQMRTAVLSAIITIALQAWLAVDYFTADPELVFRFTVIFPLASAVFNVLAAKNIYSDQLMVESFSRLRSDRKKHHKTNGR